MIPLSYPQTITQIVCAYLPKVKSHSELVAIQDAIYSLFEEAIIENHVTSVVFMDIDGVLYDNRQEAFVEEFAKRCFSPQNAYDQYLYDLLASALFSPAAMDSLQRVLTSVPGSAVVLSSNWRTNRSQYQLRKDIFSVWQFFANATISKTEYIEEDYESVGNEMTYYKFGRGIEIARWLSSHPTIKQYAIVDDCDQGLSTFHGKRFVYVNRSQLFTAQNANKVIELLQS